MPIPLTLSRESLCYVHIAYVNVCIKDLLISLLCEDLFIYLHSKMVQLASDTTL